MNDLIKRISNAKGMIEKKPNQSTVDYTIYGVLTDCDITLKSQQAEIERLQPKNGKWIFTGQKNAYGGTVIQCPFCDDKYAVHNPSDEHFCRNCGAKLMD